MFPRPRCREKDEALKGMAFVLTERSGSFVPAYERDAKGWPEAMVFREYLDVRIKIRISVSIEMEGLACVLILGVLGGGRILETRQTRAE